VFGIVGHLECADTRRMSPQKGPGDATLHQAEWRCLNMSVFSWLFFGIGHRLADFVPSLVRLVSGCGLRLLHLRGSIFSVAPSLFSRTTGLIRHSPIGQAFVAECFSNTVALPFL
jgi:hypothetical protein